MLNNGILPPAPASADGGNQTHKHFPKNKHHGSHLEAAIFEDVLVLRKFSVVQRAVNFGIC